MPTPNHLPHLIDYLSKAYKCKYVINVHAGDTYPYKHKRIIEDPVVGRSRTITSKQVSTSVVTCLDQLHKSDSPVEMLDQVRKWMDTAPIGIVTTPDRERTSGRGRWTLSEFGDLLHDAGLHVEFTGYTSGDSGEKDTCSAILTHNGLPDIEPAPDDFRIVVILTCHNEIDIITDVLMYLIDQGLQVYVVDNWSTDGTFEAAEALLGQGVVDVERFPATKPETHIFNLESIVRNVELISQRLTADWYIHYDTDEIRQSPWRNVTLKDAIYYIDRCGFNSFDHLRINFQPIDDRFRQGDSLLDSFQYYAFGRYTGDFIQVRGWKDIGQKPLLTKSLGHRVVFDGQRTYPFRFLIRHYIFRSKAQMIMKLRKRNDEADPNEVKSGFHQRHLQFDPAEETVFDDLCRQTKETFTRFEEEQFYNEFLIERLTGIGLPRMKLPLWQVLKSSLIRYANYVVRKLLRNDR